MLSLGGGTVKVALGADHGGYELKGQIKRLLIDLGHSVEDLGCNSPESVDYPDLATAVSNKIIDAGCEVGILICGTGIGMSMAVNRDPRIRAALCHDEFTARLSREHNNANILCLGARVTGPGLAEEIVKIWLSTSFSGGRHQRRIDKFSR